MVANFFSWALVIYGFVLPVSIGAASATFFPLLGIWILSLYWTRDKFGPRWGMTEAAVVFFLLASVLSSALSQRPANSFHEMYKKDLYVFVMMVTIAISRDEITIRRIVKAFVATSLLAAALGVAQYLMGINQSDSNGLGYFFYLPPQFEHWPKWALNLFGMVDGRAIGPRAHPLTFAEGLLFAWSFFICMIPATRGGRFWRWVLGAWLIEAGLLVSQSRACWLAAAAMGAGGIFIAQNWKAALRLLILLTPCLLIFVVPSFQNRVKTIAQPQQRSNLERLHMWNAAHEIWKLHPVLGIGPGNVKGASAPYQNEEEKKEGEWGHLHSTYFNFLAERGALGLFTFGLIMLAMFWELGKGIRLVSAEAKVLRISGILGIIGFLISGVTETTYNAGVITMSLYLIVGLGIASSRNEAEKS